MPAASTVANVASALSCVIPPSAAAPKINRVDACPVRPNGATGSELMGFIVRDASGDADGRVGSRAWVALWVRMLCPRWAAESRRAKLSRWTKAE